MKFKGDILITDPCYIVKKGDWTNCDYGHLMEELGFTNYICKDTLYGDWSCFVYKREYVSKGVIDKWNNIYFKFFAEYNSKEYINSPEKRAELCDVFSKKKQDFLNKYCYGEFCADAGMVGVFDLMEVRNYNPDIDKWIASHSWCAAIIPDFNGNIEYTVDDRAVHIVGTGNINFYTAQSGL